MWFLINKKCFFLYNDRMAFLSMATISPIDCRQPETNLYSYILILGCWFNGSWCGLLWILQIILLVGTKLLVIITQMGLRIRETGDVVRGEPVVQPGDDLFWFGRPKFILFLIHLVLFQVSLFTSMLIYKESNINLLCFWPLYVMTFNGRMHFNWPSLLGVR